jgi:hypothetical protein
LALLPASLFRDRDSHLLALPCAPARAGGHHGSPQRPPLWPGRIPSPNAWIGSIRRDLLDDAIVLGERHATRLLR